MLTPPHHPDSVLPCFACHNSGRYPGPSLMWFPCSLWCIVMMVQVWVQVLWLLLVFSLVLVGLVLVSVCVVLLVGSKCGGGGAGGAGRGGVAVGRLGGIGTWHGLVSGAQ